MNSTELSQAVWLDPALAARRIGFAEATLAGWRVRGNGPPFSKVGRAIRYNAAQLDAWLSAQTVTSTSAYNRSESN